MKQVAIKVGRAIRIKLQTLILHILTKFNQQTFWEEVFLLALKKMNFGNGGQFTQSGELFVAQYLQKLWTSEPKIIIFDVGANVGNYALAMTAIFDAKATIYAFEPSQKSYQTLCNNTQSHFNIIPQQLGLSDKTTRQLLFSTTKNSLLTSVYQRQLEHFNLKMDKSEEIQLFTLDEYCLANKITRIHFLKLDIEGHELFAIKGAEKMIAAKKIDCIQFEFGGCNIDSRTYFQDFYYLLKDYYKIYRVLENGIYELATYRETYEIFVTANYLAILK